MPGTTAIAPALEVAGRSAETVVEVARLDATRRPPPVRPGLVPRPRLVQRLLGSSTAPLALLVAPAGYGKTTLLAEWRDQDARPFAWLTVNDRNNDPAHLLAAIACALHDIEPVEGDVFHALENRRLPFVLVLDDAHRLRAPESLRAVSDVIKHLRAGSQIALASRRDPKLAIGRLRAHRMVVELRAPELALRADEAADLFELAGLELDDDGVAALLERTEGWPAGLYLAALAVRDQPDKRRALKRFAGDDRIVADYLRDELLAELPAEEMSFLTRTSVLDRLAGPVCDAVLGRTGGATALAAMARSNLLLVPLDRRDESYRCHPLLADALRAELRRSEPGSEAALHSRASAWYEANGDPRRAIEHAIDSGDVARAGDLLCAHVSDFIPHGRIVTVEGWLARFSDEEIGRHPSLALASAAVGLVTGHGNELRHWTQTASVALRQGGVGKRAARLEAGLAILQASGGESGMDAMRDDALRAHDLEPEGSPWCAVCRLFEGVARHLGGDSIEARRVLEEAARQAAAASPVVQTLGLAQLALVAIDEEDWDTGEARAALAVAQVERVGITDYPTQAIVFAVSSLVRARRGRIEEATRDLRQSRALLAALSDFFPWYEAETRIVLARAALRLSDVALARTLLTEAARVLRHVPEVPVLDRWLKETREQAAAGAAHAAARQLSLTTAELRVLQFLPSHLSIREIAERLFVSPNTVKTHARAVYRKLDASSRAEAVVRANETGLLDIAGSD
jgi:LuxR family maltose regulon positive regulatory protein